ncbi:MAG TPA: transketolase C-terminal domain-containing protein [Chloroflexota bacterium]|nr:transketolase C-terminal domain-containing protein [Chloroflexota bacterium]
MTRLSFAAALDSALAEEMRRDPRVFTMSTSPSPALLAELGPLRVKRMPISEATMTGIAVGSAGCGFRPVVHWRSVTFAFMAFDQVVNQACKIRYMFGGQRDFPIVFRANYATGLRSAAQHSQTGYALYAHLAGLKVVLPSGAADARGLLKSAIRDNNPVVCFEPSRIDPLEEDVADDGEGLVPIGVASVKRPGTDVTLVALGYMVYPALAAAEELSADGASVEVIDPRTLVPLDVDRIRQSVRKTGRLLVVDESPPTCSMAAEITASVAEDWETCRALRAPVRRVCTPAVPIPFSPPLEDFVLPDQARIAGTVRELLGYT